MPATSIGLTRIGLTRRSFAVTVASAAAPLLAQKPESPAAAPPPFAGTLLYRPNRVSAKVEPFPMTQVRLLPGRFADAAKWNRDFMERLPAERLIRNFRLNAGLASSAAPLGGWEQYGSGREAELRGHFTGHYLSACALSYAATGDEAVKNKGGFLVDQLAQCQRKLGAGGYLSAFPAEWFDRLDARRKVWAPFYTVHKIMAGLFDMYQFTGNQQALAVLQGMADWADRWTASKTPAHMQDILETEYGGMNDILYKLAEATSEERWARAGDRFTKNRFFNPLVSRRDQLQGLHVNTHIPQVIGAARRYEISGDMRFHDVADFFWYEVVSARAYVTGGTSNNEAWLAPPRHLFAELQRSSATAECCCAYNMMKLTRHLYSWTGDPRYFDYYERLLLNHRLGTIHPETGATQYYLSHSPGAWRTFGTEDNSFWCCTGTGVEEYSKLNDSIYWRDGDGVYVNLFVSSDLTWPQKGFHLRQQTRFPDEAATSFSITADPPVPLALHLRIPAWLPAGAVIKVNGRAVDASASPGSYLTLRETWKTGDRIEMDLPMSLREEVMPDDSSVRAALYGPLVLACDLGSEGLTEKMIAGRLGPDLHPPGDLPVFKTSIQPGRDPLMFQTSGFTLAPLNTILDKRYSIYWRATV